MASRLRSGKKRGPDTDSETEDDGKFRYCFMSQITFVMIRNNLIFLNDVSS